MANAKTGAAALAAAGATLKSAGLRLTGPRRAILAALDRRSEPASCEQIHAGLGPGRCDLVTVYRSLAAFVEAGIARRRPAPDGTALYELGLGRPPRYRVVGRRSRRTAELDAASAAELAAALGRVEQALRERGYTDVGHLAEFFGEPPPEAVTRPAPSGSADRATEAAGR